LIPEGFSKQLDIQRALYGGMRDFARVWKTAKGDQIPYPTVNDTSNIGSTVNEAGDLTSGTTDVTFGEKTFNAYKVHADMLKVNNELILDSYFDFEQILSELLGERIGRKENALFTTGNGSSTPNGVVSAAQQCKRIASTSTVTRSEIIDLIHSVDPYYRKSPKAMFMFNDTTLGVIKKLAVGSSDDRALWQPSMIAGEPDKLEGFPYVINQSVAALAASGKFMLFGDGNKFIIRDAGMPRMVVARERFIEYDQTAFDILVRVDSDILVASAVKYLIGATS
jgi:HK97 family phage major capsid protein